MLIAEELAKKTVIPDIRGTPRTIQDRIARVKLSLAAIGEIPTATKIGRPSKMVQEVRQMLANKNTDNPYLRGKKLANQIVPQLNLPMSFWTVNTMRK